ncbi:hypothetical protein J6590_005625 [Homalodisca vitripennis]|nr:hypothetical protein J6590_005625 [Homalodisca vitripennis]
MERGEMARGREGKGVRGQGGREGGRMFTARSRGEGVLIYCTLVTFGTAGHWQVQHDREDLPSDLYSDRVFWVFYRSSDRAPPHVHVKERDRVEGQWGFEIDTHVREF